ncbi:phage tail protein [Embleya sp. NPDC056575]|uniref:phage distal tail protein n=1 Tax=unclassified Embleya TaxID=2699296 RepID=UPI003689B6F5
MAGELIVTDDQVQYGSLLLGGGSPYVITADGIEGWEDMPGLDSTDQARPSQDGLWPGARYLGARMVTIPVSIYPDWDAGRRTGLALLRELQRQIRPHADEQPLVIRIGGESLMCWARINTRVTERLSTTWMAAGELDLTLQWVATDPLRYSIVESVASTPLPQRSQGLLWTAVSGTDRLDWVTAGSVSVLDWGTEGTPGGLVVVNDGTEDTRPRFTITGPVTTPAVIRTDTGDRLEYDIALAAGDTLTIDTRCGSVLLNGTASRDHLATGRSVLLEEFVCPPGSTALAFGALDGASPATMTAVWRSAYL